MQQNKLHWHAEVGCIYPDSYIFYNEFTHFLCENKQEMRKKKKKKKLNVSPK
jgi:hypothetical protein